MANRRLDPSQVVTKYLKPICIPSQILFKLQVLQPGEYLLYKVHHDHNIRFEPGNLIRLRLVIALEATMPSNGTSPKYTEKQEENQLNQPNKQNKIELI